MGLVRVLAVDAEASLIVDLREGADETLTIDLAAATIGEADAAAEAIRPSVVVVELGNDTFAAFALVARLHETQPDVPVIAVSPIGDPTLASFAVLCGARGLVVASRRAEELPSAMAAVLRGRRWFSPVLVDELFRQIRELVSDPVEAVLARLSPRETEVVRLVAGGMGYAAMARALHISPRTVRTHVRNIAQKLGVSTGRDLLDGVRRIGIEAGVGAAAGREDQAAPPGDGVRPSAPS